MNILLLTRSFRWAFFASVAPSAAHSTTTLALGHGSGSGIGAAAASSVTESVETKFLSDIDTFLAVTAQYVAGRTFAFETSFAVDTVSFVAQFLVHKTFVNIYRYSNNNFFFKFRIW